MLGFVATKLDEFEQGKISRRRLIETLTLAATAGAATSRANAAEGAPNLKVALVNHISYTCPNFRQAGDWYSKVFNLDQVGLKDTEVTLPFGKKGEQPYNVAAKDVPLTFLIARTRDQSRPPADAAAAARAARPRPEAVIDHIGFTVANFIREKTKAELIAMGVKNVRDGGLYSLHLDDPFGYDVQISGLENNALTDG
jgi:catechol 2,3-dioxygenase-like lactoylglutathione lyase family enzyme